MSTPQNPTAKAAQDAARRPDGKFGDQPRDEGRVRLEETGDGRQTLQVSAPFERLSLDASNRMSRELVRMVGSGHLDLDPPYQRPSVWTRDQQRGIVRSWLQGIPIPAITVNDRTTPGWTAEAGERPLETGRGMYAVIDGKQRLEAACAWFDGELDVPASWFKEEDVAETTMTDDGPYVTFDQLTKRGQSILALGGGSPMPMNTAKVKSVEAEADLYLLLNGSGTPQTDDDMANAAQVAGRADQG